MPQRQVFVFRVRGVRRALRCAASAMRLAEHQLQEMILLAIVERRAAGRRVRRAGVFGLLRPGTV
jgi:hypothetical protein